jgi:hypothetical protein
MSAHPRRVTPRHPAGGEHRAIRASTESLSGRLERALPRFRVQAAHNVLDEAPEVTPGGGHGVTRRGLTMS